MKTLEEIFSTKEQRELLEKYEDANDRILLLYREIEHYGNLLLDTLPIKRGVWFKYGERTGMIKDVRSYDDLSLLGVKYNPKGVTDYPDKDDEWLTINILADLDKIQVIPEDECSNRHPDSDSNYN